jgi:hypothetical protein
VDLELEVRMHHDPIDEQADELHARREVRRIERASDAADKLG